MTPTMSLERGHSPGAVHGTSLDEARDLVRSDDFGKWDRTVAREDVQLCGGHLVFPHESGDQHLAPSTWATGQLCARLGIPTPYFRKCPADLQDAQANHWLRYGAYKPGERWLLRAKDHNLRAILSDRYSPLDNRTLLDELRSLLPASYRVDWFGLAQESLHLRVINPERYREVLPNDALTVGIHLANSEVGLRSVTVDALVYRLVCTNGLIRLVKGKSLMRQRHLYVSEHRFVGVLAEAIENALLESEAFLEQMQTATVTPVPEIESTLEHISGRWSLSDETQDAAKQALRQEPGSQQESLYGLVNAFTAAARSLPDEQRYDLEMLAGQLAAHGVAAYAPRLKRRGALEPGGTRSAMQTNGHELHRDAPLTEPLNVATGLPGADIVDLARDMFQADVVGRHLTGRRP